MLSSRIRREHVTSYLYPQIRLLSHWAIYGSLCGTSSRLSTSIFIQLGAGVVAIAETFLLRPSFNGSCMKTTSTFYSLSFREPFFRIIKTLRFSNPSFDLRLPLVLELSKSLNLHRASSRNCQGLLSREYKISSCQPEHVWK